MIIFTVVSGHDDDDFALGLMLAEVGQHLAKRAADALFMDF